MLIHALRESLKGKIDEANKQIAEELKRPLPDSLRLQMLRRQRLRSEDRLAGHYF